MRAPSVEEFERSHDLGAGDRMTPHHLPFLVGERARFPQNALGHRDLAQVVEQTRVGDGHRLAGPQTRGQRQPPREGRHAFRVAARVLVFCLQGIGQPEQALENGALKLPVRLLQVDGIGQRLLVCSAQLVARPLHFLLARPRHLVEVAEVARIGKSLGQRYIGRHDRCLRHQRLDEGEERERREGLGQILVGARLSTASPVRLLARRGEHDDGRSRQGRVAPASAGTPRDHRVSACARRAESGRASGGGREREPPRRPTLRRHGPRRLPG